MTLGNEAQQVHQNIPTVGHWKQFLEGNGIRALMKDNNVAVMDKECPRCCKIAELEVIELIIEKLLQLGGFDIKQGHLEDKRDAFRAGGGGKPLYRALIFRSVG